MDELTDEMKVKFGEAVKHTIAEIVFECMNDLMDAVDAVKEGDDLDVEKFLEDWVQKKIEPVELKDHLKEIHDDSSIQP